MDKRILIIFIAALCAVQACKSSRKITAENKYDAKIDSMDLHIEELDEVVVKASKDNPYRGSVTRSFDLIHTKLEIRPDWQNQHVYGKATLTLKPYFYPTDSLVLNAKGLDVKSIKLSGTAEALSFTNDSLLLHIRLPKVYTPQNQLELVIDYTAKPNERKSGGSAAITDDKGLYFINPTGKDPNKPTQLWSQGETESNSCWFDHRCAK
jgi:aminopeptidase N